MTAHLPGEPCPCFDCRADEPEQQQEQPYPDEPYPDVLVTPDAVEAAARAMAILNDYDGCFERLDAWANATAEERECHDVEEPMDSDQESADWWRELAAAAAPYIAQQTLLDAVQIVQSCNNATDEMCEVIQEASDALTARAATLTPKDTP